MQGERKTQKACLYRVSVNHMHPLKFSTRSQQRAELLAIATRFPIKKLQNLQTKSSLTEPII